MICSSWSWPNMFDVARNKINLYNDTRSIINRVKLLMLTDPTELYMNPNFGVGLKKYLFTYNNDNTVALIRDKLIDQLRLWEPSVIPEETKVTRTADTGLETEGITAENPNQLNLTVTLVTSRMKVITFNVTEDDFTNLT